MTSSPLHFIKPLELRLLSSRESFYLVPNRCLISERLSNIKTYVYYSLNSIHGMFMCCNRWSNKSGYNIFISTLLSSSPTPMFKFYMSEAEMRDMLTDAEMKFIMDSGSYD